MSATSPTPAVQALSNGQPLSNGQRAGRGGVIPPPHARWRRGQSGNPTGRPKGGSPREAMRSFAAKRVQDLKPETVAEHIAANMLMAAVGTAGDRIPAAKLVIENVDGAIEAPRGEGVTVAPVVIVIQGQPANELRGDAWEEAARQYLASLPDAANGG